MPDTVTVTGTVGPGSTVTAVVITDVTEFRVDTVQSMLYVRGIICSNAPQVYEFNISVQNTFSVTKIGFGWTVTISA